MLFWLGVYLILAIPSAQFLFDFLCKSEISIGRELTNLNIVFCFLLSIFWGIIWIAWVPILLVIKLASSFEKNKVSNNKYILLINKQFDKIRNRYKK